MAKKEKVSDYLKSGKREVQDYLGTEEEPFVKITTATGCYSFIETNDPVSKKTAYDYIDSYVKREERRLANKLNYGDERGRGAVYCDNQTAKDLGLLHGRPDYLRVAYRAYVMSQKAPEKLRRYVYHNMIVLANRFYGDAEKFYLQDISAYTFEVLPPAWRKCLDDPCPELEGVTLFDILEPLTPSFKEGQSMARKMIGGKFVKCKVVGIEYNYQYTIRRGELGSNPFVLEYRVKNVDDNSRCPHYYNVRRDNAYPAFHADELKKK